MKYTITINQSAVFTNGLINKTDLVDWAIIDYLKDFALYKKAKKIRYKGGEYIWLNYQHLINSLPLLQIKGTWTVSRRVSKLRKLGLIKTVKDKDNTLYYTFTDKLIDICFAKESDLKRVRNNASGCLCERPEGARQSHSFAVSKIASAAPRNDNNVLIATDPIAINATDPIAPSATAQYKTKISIINKDYNNKETSFNSSFLKNKQTEKPQMNTDKHRIINNVGQGFSLANRERTHKGLPYENRIRKNPHGFKSMSGIWNVISQIRERQYTNKNIRMNSRINSDYIRDPRRHYEQKTGFQVVQTKTDLAKIPVFQRSARNTQNGNWYSL